MKLSFLLSQVFSIVFSGYKPKLKNFSSYSFLLQDVRGFDYYHSLPDLAATHQNKKIGIGKIRMEGMRDSMMLYQ